MTTESSLPSTSNAAVVDIVNISVSDAYDGGNGKFIEHRHVDSTSAAASTTSGGNDVSNEVIVHIRPDVRTELEHIRHMQYFSFRVTVCENTKDSSTTTSSNKPITVRYVLGNASEVSYPEAWAGTTICWSACNSDVDSWSRNLSTVYTEGQLSWEHTHSSRNESIYFAYFPPYSYQRHLELIAQCNSCCSNAAITADGSNYKLKVYSLGQTLKGREIDCIRVGSGSKIVWIIHRQHPGETQAEHYAEGLLHRLLRIDTNGDDTVVHEALEKFTFYIIPNMCPDGAVLGHLRTNSVGANLNREWATVHDNYVAPSVDRSPEVYYVLRHMDNTGVDAFVDVHSDEELPFTFLSGADHVPNWSERLQALHGAFAASYQRINSDLQTAYGYPPPSSPEEVLKYMNVATNQVVNRFECLGVTLEMPFKDCLTNPDPDVGFTPARCRKLGANVLEPLLYVEPYLRTTNGDAWIQTELRPDDAYIVTTDEYENDAANDDFVPLKKRFYSDVHEFRKTTNDSK